MVMRFFLVVVLCGLLANAKAADPKYPVITIPEELKKDVNVVVREDHMTFKIHSQSKATLTVLMVATILNSNGQRYASTSVGYDKLSKVTNFKASAYDAMGNLIRRLKSHEIYDHSDFDGLYSDNRSKSADVSQNSYPYTVEFEYEVEYRFLFFIPGSIFVPDEKVSVQHASYSLIYPSELKPRYKAMNVSVTPAEENMADGFQKTSWKFENLLPIKFEPMGPSRGSLVPQVIAAPSKFEYDGYSGSMDTWVDFGKWISSLNKGRNNLPEPTKQKAKEITTNLKTTEEKTKALYTFLQSKTRYVSIQLGIGGFQPFEASVVDQTGYGDCKALSNYMISLLDAVGIKSHYVLIRAGEGVAPIRADFSSSQFNHAIVAVPNGADTLWLECTDQANPFGYMGTFTGDRKALLITNDGAKVVKTIQYTGEQNTQFRSAEVTVLANGDATAKVKTTYSGLQYENDNLYFHLDDQFDEQRKWLQETTEIPSFDIGSFKMINKKDKVPSAIVAVDLNLRRFATVSGKRLFLTPNLMNRSNFVPEKVESRKTMVVRRMAYVDIDTIRYRMPEGIYPEFMPQPAKLTSRFGEYEATFTLDQDNLIYIRKLKMNKGEFPAESYNELVEFYRNVNKADNTKMVFLSKT
jgi:transglutaminase-like putative cysteine protease